MFRRFALAAMFLLVVAPAMATAQNEGQDLLDKATDLKLMAESLSDLQEVIELCESAIEKGLDEGNSQIARQLLAASALQRAQALVQRLPRVARNPNAVRQLRRQTVSDLKKAIENNPKLATAFVLRARMEMLPGGSRSLAMENLNQAIDLLADKPVDLSEAYILRAAIQERNADKLADLTKAIEADSTNAQAWQARVALQMAMGKLQEAVDDAEKMLEQDEDNDFALQAAIESLLMLQRPDEAIDLLSARIEKDPDNGAFYRVRASAYLIKEDNENALTDLDKAIELNADDYEALIARGRVYFGMEEIEKAKRDISRSLLIEPNNVEGIIYRSIIAGHEQRYSDAIADMELLVDADPNNSGWIRQLASFYHLDDRPRKAVRLLDELIARDEQDWRSLRLRGDARLAISEHQDAVSDYEESLAVLKKMRRKQDGEDNEQDTGDDIDFSGLLNNLAWVLATSPLDELRDGPRSVELGLQACEATDYQAAHILSTLAAGYAEVGDFENARKWSAKAVELAEEEGNDQLEQLREELESYEEEKPWREEQNVEENRQPVASASETIET